MLVHIWCGRTSLFHSEILLVSDRETLTRDFRRYWRQLKRFLLHHPKEGSNVLYEHHMNRSYSFHEPLHFICHDLTI